MTTFKQGNVSLILWYLLILHINEKGWMDG